MANAIIYIGEIFLLLYLAFAILKLLVYRTH